MEAELVDKLQNCTEFSDELINILTAITRDIHRDVWDIYLNRLVPILVGFTTQTKISYMNKNPTGVINVHLIQKTFNDYCLDITLQLLLKLIKFKKDMAERIADLYLDHFENQPTDSDALSIFFKICYFSEKMIGYLRARNYVGIFVEHLEKLSYVLIRETESSERTAFINNSYKNYFGYSLDFYSNLNRYVQSLNMNSPMLALNPLAVPSDNPMTNAENIMAGSPDEEEISKSPISRHTQNRPGFDSEHQHGNPTNVNQPVSEQSSFSIYPGNPSQQGGIPLSSVGGINTHGKGIKVPALNLPTSINENANTISRSTRRADPYKSISTNSNRFSTTGLGSTSLDIGGKDLNARANNENNISLYDAENSYFYEDNNFKIISYISAQDKMKSLANQLGEYCLTVDLGCMLAHKRKVQLDQVANMTIFQDVDSIMDIKVDEKMIKEKLNKKRKMKHLKKKKNNIKLSKIKNLEIKEVESSRNSEESSEEESPTGQPEVTFQGVKFLDKDKGKNVEVKKKGKQDLKAIGKMVKILANLIYYILKDYDINKLQNFSSLVSTLYLYLSTHSAQEIREKELRKLASSSDFWEDQYDAEFQTRICEGIDNIDNIDRHYEKTLIEQYRAKQKSTFTSNQGNNVIGGQTNQNQPLNLNLNLNKISTEKKTSSGKMNLRNAEHNISGNPKIIDSTLLHFSTTYENTNSSAFTYPDESIDSIDELNLNQNVTNVDTMLLSENIIYFKLLDLFAVLSEKTHELLVTKYNTYNNVGGNASSNTGNNIFEEHNLSDLHSPGGQNKGKFGPDVDKIYEISNLSTLRYGEQDNFKLQPKGLNVNPNDDVSQKFLKKCSNLFLNKFERKFSWVLNNLDMNQPYFYEIETEQLQILHHYLENCTSRNTVFEVMDHTFDLLLFVKKQILDLSAGFISQLNNNTTANNQANNANSMSNRIFTPNSGPKTIKTGSLSSKDFQNLIQQPTNPPNSNNTVGQSNFMRSYFKAGARKSQDVSPSKVQANTSEIKDDNLQAKLPVHPGTYSDSLYLTSFIFRQRKLFSAYLGIISRLILRSPKTDVYTLLNGIFISNESWLEVLKLYVGGVFFELAELIERSEHTLPNLNSPNHNANAEFEFDKDKISLFIEAKQILEYYNAVLYMCSWIIFKEKLNNATKDPSKKKWKNIIRKILQNIMYLIKPNIGILSEYLVNNSNLNSLLISSQSGALNNFNLLRIRLLKSILELSTKVFGFNARFSCFLTEEIAGFYIRFAYINFVKLYSHSNNSELNEINMKINEISNKVRRNNPNINADVENLTKLMRDSSPYLNTGNNPGANNRGSYGANLNAQRGKGDDQADGLGGQNRKNTEARSYQIILSNQYVKLLFAIARNRTDEIKRKFYQYRILEFFSREIDLEFDISQIRERFLRIRNEAKRRFSNADNQNNLFQNAEQEIVTKSNKDRVPNLTLNQPKQNTPKSTISQPTSIKSPQGETIAYGTKTTPKVESSDLPATGGTRPKLDLSKLSLGKSQNNQAAMEYKKNYENQLKAESNKDLKSAHSEESKGKEILKTELKTEHLPGDTEESLKGHLFNMQDNSFAEQGEESKRSQKMKQSDRSNVIKSGRNDRELLDTEEHDTELSRRIQMMHQMQQAKKRPPIPSLNLANTATPSYYGGGIIQNESKPMQKPQQQQQTPQMQLPISNVVNNPTPVEKVQINLANLGKPSQNIQTQQDTQEPAPQKKSESSGRAQNPHELKKLPSSQLQPKEEKQEPVEKPEEEYWEPQKKLTLQGTEEDEELGNQSNSGIISLREQKPNQLSKNAFYENVEGQSIDPEFGGRSPTGKLDISNFNESRLGSMQLNTNKQAPDSNTSALHFGAPQDRGTDSQATENKPKFKIPALKLPAGIGFTNQDPKYAGSPRDLNQKNPKANENFSFGSSNPAKKNVPSLKISGIDREQFHKNDYGAYEPNEKEGVAEGDLTKLEKSLNMSNPKMQLLLEGKKKVHSPKKTDQNLLVGKEQTPLNLEELLTENIFYYSERKLRKIYEDDELHVLVLSLMICLLLTPTRGTLDDHYCSQFPINNGKPNILYILHFHLNHPSNQHILPLLLQKMSEINPFPAGQRLLKLLCASFTDTTIYTDWKKIATGAYGTIYECNTNLADPQTVAIKQLSLPKSIYERCVLHDIFTEITCLESFRLDPCITDMYDYGVTDHDYIIVMKKYPSSLKDWRVKQEGNWMDNLPTYMTIFRDILKGISLLHSHNVTHYDLKCDNVLLDYKTNSYSNSKWLNDSEIRITIGDFGECKMFVDEDDEFDLRNRGTEYIKSPEMLTLTLNSKKEADNFDRRKKIGTTRSSDIWSLGCLFYELLTGDFLFFHRDWIYFYIRVTSPSEVLLTEDMLQKIGHNTYLIDFLKYILVRDPQHRPSIDNVLKRFEHIHAILVSGSNYADKYALQHPLNNAITLNFSLESCIENYMELLFPTNETIQEKITLPHLLKHPPLYMKIMDEIHICSRNYFLQHADKLIQGGITHVVTTSNLLEERNLLRFKRLMFRLKDDQKHELTPYLIASRVMDFLREVFLYRGNLLIIEDDNLSVNSKPDKLVLRTALLFCLTYFFRCSVYETWTLINSQILFYVLPFSNLSLMSNFMVQQFKIIQFLNAFPKVQCICGCATIVLKRQFNVDKNINVTACACSRDSRTLEFSDCPSDGCAEYMRFVKDRYKIQWESLKWAYFGPNDFVVGPKNTGVVQDKLHVQIVMNSEGLQENTTVYPRKSKRSGLNQTQLLNKEKWDIYSCKVCQMWLYAVNKKDAKYALIMNNLIKKKSNGIMIPQPQFNFKIRTPILRNFKCCELR